MGDATPAGRRHRPVTRLLHWLVAALILVQIPLAWHMMDLPVSPDKFGKYALHKSLGMVVFSLTVLRLGWRWLRPPPSPPGSPAQILAARATHALMYVVVLAMPLTGWIA